MQEQVKPDPKEAVTQEAQQLAESIAENPKSAPTVDFEDDYELAQAMSKSSVDGGEDKREKADK